MASIDPELNIWTDRSDVLPAGEMVSKGQATRRRAALAAKRALDVAGAALLLFLLLPLFALVALAVRLSGPGPVVFRQPRIGRHGRTFTMYKFRTMGVGAHEQEEALALAEPNRIFLKLERDPRVTPVGRFLRRYSLDELPQLVNVLEGEMSLIGPRPLLPSDYAKFPRNGWMRRFEMTPGLTGLWQVSGRSLCSEGERIRLDLEYLDRWSLGLDLKIALRTPLVVFSGFGAV